MKIIVLENVKMNDKINVLNSPPVVLPRYGYLHVREDLRLISNLVEQTEYESVKRGLRLANRYHLTPFNFDKEIEKVSKDGLVFLPISRVKNYSGFIHEHIYINDIDQNTLIYGVIAKDLDVAKDFVDAHNNEVDHKSIGEMLGYPECCRNAFVKFWERSFDPIQEIAKETTGHKNCVDGVTTIIENADPNLYVHLRYFGIRIIPFFPCSYHCEESKNFAKKWISLMKDIDSKTTDKLLKLINMPSKWDLYNAQIIVSHPFFMGRATSYYDINRKVVVFR